MAYESIRIIHGDIFKYRKGILIIPRSTAGTINESFEQGLRNLKIKYVPLETPLGAIQLIETHHRDLRIIYATSVQSGSSSYGAIQLLARNLQEKLYEATAQDEDVYCPLLGTGAGQLEPFLAYVYLTLPFGKSDLNRYRFNVVVFEKIMYNAIYKSKEYDRFDLLNRVLKTLYKRLQMDASIQAVLNDVNFFYQRASNCLAAMMAAQLSDVAKQQLIEDHAVFDGNFQQFIDAQVHDRLRDYLVLVGKVVAHVDSKGYNKQNWNTNEDKRTLAHANVRQNHWVRNLMLYSLHRNTDGLPSSIRNAIEYLSNPDNEIPMLSVADRGNVLFTFIREEVPDFQFGGELIKYFRAIVTLEPKCMRNWGALVSRILYSPLVRLLWDYDIHEVEHPSVLDVNQPNEKSWNQNGNEQTQEISENVHQQKPTNRIKPVRPHIKDKPESEEPEKWSLPDIKPELNDLLSDTKPSDNTELKTPPDNGQTTETKAERKKSKVKFGQNLHNDAYTRQDSLDYESYAQTLFNFIKNQGTKSPLTVGIYAPWGMGKTSLMRAVQKKFDDNIKVVNDAYWETREIATSYFKGRVATFKRWLYESYNRCLPALNSALSFLHSRAAKPLKVPDAKIPPATPNEKLRFSDVMEEIKKPPFAKNLPGKYSNPTVWFNAWKYENSEQVYSGLAYTIIDELVKKLPSDFERERFFLNINRVRMDHDKLKRDIRSKIYGAIFNKVTILYISGAILVAFLAFWIPAYIFGASGALFIASVIQATKAINAVKKTDATAYLSQFITRPNYEEKLGYFHEVEADLKKVLEELVNNDNRCVIFIDDLDRCSSKTVVEVIEAINLFINSEFSHCYFIIGMDAQMVSASIEAAYDDINQRLPALRKLQGSLGWYFMEKFVQLQFNIPSISERSGKLFLNRLLGGLEAIPSVNVDIQQLKSQALSIDLTDKESVKELAASLIKAEFTYPREVIEIKTLIVNRASETLNEIDTDAIEMLSEYSQYLCISPRVIKRFVNLYRFYWFMKLANITSGMNALEEQEIAKMTIISIRWPQLLRLVQWTSEFDFGDTSLKRAVCLDLEFANKQSTRFDGNDLQWAKDPVLLDFISKSQIKLERFVQVGAW